MTEYILPTHPRTGLTALGFTSRGPVWPILGGSAPTGAEGAAGAAGAATGDAVGQAAAAGQQAGSATGSAGAAATTGTAGQATAGQQAAAGQQQAAGQQAAADDVSSLPDWAQKIIKDARKDAGDARVAGKTAADQAAKDIADKIAVALGQKPDPTTDPAKLAEQVAAAQTEAKDTAVQLAVFQAAAKPTVGGDPGALLDSNSFMATVKALDHKAADFAAKVEAAVTEALKNNPKLKAAQAAGVSGGQFAGGPGEGKGRPTSLNAAIAASQQRTG